MAAAPPKPAARSAQPLGRRIRSCARLLTTAFQDGSGAGGGKALRCCSRRRAAASRARRSERWMPPSAKKLAPTSAPLIPRLRGAGTSTYHGTKQTGIAASSAILLFARFFFSLIFPLGASIRGVVGEKLPIPVVALPLRRVSCSPVAAIFAPRLSPAVQRERSRINEGCPSPAAGT